MLNIGQLGVLERLAQEAELQSQHDIQNAPVDQPIFDVASVSGDGEQDRPEIGQLGKDRRSSEAVEQNRKKGFLRYSDLASDLAEIANDYHV